MREGDILVTRVAHHYALGRLNADCRTQTAVEAQNQRTDALSRACELAGADHHVFLCELAGPGAGDYIDIDCAEPDNHGERRFKPRAL